MTVQLYCFEADARPSRATLEVEPSRGATLWLLLAGAPGLRATVLRPRDADAPPDAVRLVEIDVVLAPGGAAIARVRAPNPQIEFAVIRGETRTRLVADVEVRALTRFEAVLPDGRVQIFALDVATSTRQGARHTAGSGRTTSLEPSSRQLRALWVIPSLWESLEDPQTRLSTWFSQRTPSWLRSRWVQIGLALALGAAGTLATQWRASARVDEAEQRARAAEGAAATAEANLDAALAAEASCNTERRALAERMADLVAETAARIDVALALGDTRSRAIAQGGPRMQTPDLLTWDRAAVRDLQRAVAEELERFDRDPPDVAACLAQGPLLGTDLPAYALLWHGDPDRVCTSDYAAVRRGVDLAGRWGLSSRVADAFGAPVSAPAAPFGPVRNATVDDPRTNDVWSASALAAGLRATEQALLRAQVGDRPPVAPGQLHLWTLAIFSAYNGMTSAAGGVMDQPVERCVGDLVRELAQREPAARPGQPVLPDLSFAATRDVPVTPTAGCPWPERALGDGAVAALRAVARAAQLGQAPPSGF